MLEPSSRLVGARKWVLSTTRLRKHSGGLVNNAGRINQARTAGIGPTKPLAPRCRAPDTPPGRALVLLNQRHRGLGSDAAECRATAGTTAVRLQHLHRRTSSLQEQMLLRSFLAPCPQRHQVRADLGHFQRRRGWARRLIKILTLAACQPTFNVCIIRHYSTALFAHTTSTY